MKTPLRDVLDFKSLQVLKQLIPQKSIVSTFLFYSGAIEFNLSHSDRFVVAHTNKGIIYEFWKCVEADSAYVAKQSKYFFDCLFRDESQIFPADSMFQHIQETWMKRSDPFARASYFFLLNRCSKNGLISSGELNLKNANPLAFSALRNIKFKNFHTHFDKGKDFIDSIRPEEKSDYLLFPVGKYHNILFKSGNVAGCETTPVNHQELYENLKQYDKKWVVLYKNHSDVFKLYEDYAITMVDKYGKRTTKKDKCEDIVIANF